MTRWPVTKRAWSRMKLSIAECLVMNLIETPETQHDAVRNIALLGACDEIRSVREMYYRKELS